MSAFRKREFPVLICTDVAARGLDLQHVSVVLHMHSLMGKRELRTETSAASFGIDGGRWRNVDGGGATSNLAQAALTKVPSLMQTLLSSIETYVHRAGRLRNGGESIVFLGRDDKKVRPLASRVVSRNSAAAASVVRAKKKAIGKRKNTKNFILQKAQRGYSVLADI